MAFSIPATVSQHLAHFSGRTWLLPIIQEWLEHGSERIFLLTGGPGTGKSMISGWLAGYGTEPEDEMAKGQLNQLRQQVNAAHFFQANSRNKSPLAFAEKIANQLSQTIPGFDDALVESLKLNGTQINVIQNIDTVEAGATVVGVAIKKINLHGLVNQDPFDLGFVQPLKHLYANGYNQPLLILVDALDEVFTDKDEGAKILLLLSQYLDLPAQVRFIATSRPDPRILKQFSRACRFDLVADIPDGTTDIFDYAYQNLLQKQKISSDKQALAQGWARRIDEASKGIFLYAYMILRDVMPQLDTLDRFDEFPLPEGLRGIYREFLNREVQTDEDRWFKELKPLLGMIAVAQAGGIGRSQLRKSLQNDPTANLRKCHQYLSGPLNDGPFRLFHKSLADYLLEDETNIDYEIKPLEMHEKIAATYNLNSPIDWDKVDDYYLRHVADHLGQAGQLAELEQLLLDFNYLQAKLDRTDIYNLTNDFDYLPRDKEASVSLVQGALRLAIPALAMDKTQLAGQLIGRLQGFDEPALQTLVAKAGEWSDETWLRPLHTTLTPPGNALLRILTGHTQAVNDMATITDETIISASDDNTLKVWDLLKDVGALKTLQGHEDKVTAVAVTPDGKQAVSASLDKTLKVWNLDNGTECASYNIETTLTKPMFVTPERQIVGTIHDDEGGQYVRMWQLPSDTKPADASSSVAQKSEEASLAYDPDKKSFAKRFVKGLGYIFILPLVCTYLFLWFIEDLPTSVTDLGDFGIFFIIFVVIAAIIYFFIWLNNDTDNIDIELLQKDDQTADPNNSANSSDNKLKRSRQKIGRVTAKKARKFILIFSGVMTSIFALWATVLLWNAINSVGINDTASGHTVSIAWVKAIIEELSQSDSITDFELALSAIIFFVLLGGIVWYGYLVVYSFEDVDSIAFWQEKNQVMTVARNHKIKVRDLHSRGWLMTIHGQFASKFFMRLKPISAMEITSDGQYMVHASDNSLALRPLKPNLGNWLRSWVYLKQLSTQEGPISALVTLPDNERFVSASQNTLKLWNLKKETSVARIGGITQVNALLVTPNGQWVISAANDRTLKVWDVAQGEGARDSTHYNQLKTISLVADDSLVVYISDSDQSQRSRHHNLRVWDAHRDKASPIGFYMGRLDVVGIAPDVNQAISVRGKRLTLWNLDDGKKIYTVSLHHFTRWRRLPKLIKNLANKLTFTLIKSYFKGFIK